MDDSHITYQSVARLWYLMKSIGQMVTTWHLGWMSVYKKGIKECIARDGEKTALEDKRGRPVMAE